MGFSVLSSTKLVIVNLSLGLSKFILVPVVGVSNTKHGLDHFLVMGLSACVKVGHNNMIVFLNCQEPPVAVLKKNYSLTVVCIIYCSSSLLKGGK